MPHLSSLDRPSRDAGRALPAALLVLAAALAAVLGACSPSPQRVAADRAEILATLETYGRQLSQAYAFADPSVLAEVAMPREVASVENNIARMANDGRRIAADQKELAIEDLDLFQIGDAYVRTFEVWDIRVLAVGSEQEISRDEAQESRVRYRMKKDDEGHWKVLWRQRLEDEGGGGASPVAGGEAAGTADESGAP